MREIELSAEAYGHEPSRLRGYVVDYDRRMRLRRAAAISAPLFAGALLSIPIPGWHFIGAPGFGIAAFVLGRRRLRQAWEMSSLEGPCPACEAQQSLPSPSELPASVVCPGCGEYVKVSELR